MHILATCLAKPKLISWKGREQYTGIYKVPVDGPIHLGPEGVESDCIGNPKVHGGEHKACYLYSAGYYPYWKSHYPNLEWDWGMFGENLTVANMADDLMRIGDIYQIGTAVVQVSMPREPCYKLGIKFNDQDIITKFIAYGNPGAYARILEPGEVRKGDRLNLIEKSENTLTIVEFFRLHYALKKDPYLLDKALANKALPEYKRRKLLQFQKKGG